MKQTAKHLQKVARCFIKPHKYSENTEKMDAPAVILLRHNNLRGPLNAFVSLEKVPHLWVLDLFFDKTSCYRQYRDYTFALRRGKAAKKFSLKAAFATAFAVPIVRASGAVPVYRGKRNISKTMEHSAALLLQGETIAIAVDKDYSNTDAPIFEIYTGFFRLEHAYFDATGEHLPFYALRFKNDHTMECSQPLTFHGEQPFPKERKALATAVMDFLNTPKG